MSREYQKSKNLALGGSGIPGSSIEDPHLFRQRALAARRDSLQRLIEAHQGLLRDLYHVLQTQTTMTITPSASARAGEDPPELQRFIMKHSLSNPQYTSIMDVDGNFGQNVKVDESFHPNSHDTVLYDSTGDVSPPLNENLIMPPTLEPSPLTHLQTESQEGIRRDDSGVSLRPPDLSSRTLKHDAWRTKTFEPVVFADDEIPLDVKEESPSPPHLAISPSLLSKSPIVFLSSHHSPIRSVLHGDYLESIPAPMDSDNHIDERLYPLTSQYAGSLYPLPPVEFQKKRKKEARRTTTSGTPVVDLTRWEAMMLVNPTSRLAKKVGKCLTTSEWQVMFNEVRYVKAMRRINELKAQGIWSFRQPKKQKGPILYKSHQDYLLEEMKWMQTDFREERKWKIAVAMELAYSALEWHRADGEQRRELTVRWQIPLTDDELDADRVKEEVMDVEMRDEGREEESPPARRSLRGSALVSNAENEAQPVTRRTGATITIRQDLRQDDEDDADDDDDEEDDETAAKAVEKQAAIDAVNAVREAAEDLEAHAREEQVPKIELDDSPQEPSTKAGSDMDGDGDPDEDMDAEGEADDADGAGDPNNEENPEPLGIPDVADMDASISIPRDTQDPQTSVADVHQEGLKANSEDAALSSTATSILDPQTLRGPVLDLELGDTVINLSELLNRSLAMADPISTPDKFDIALPALFPELNVYSFSAPPKAESIDKKNKRIDESGMSSGRLTLTTRLLDSKNVLVSALQPGQRYRRGAWEDTNDIPGMEESFSQLRTDAIPPAAPMFCGSKPQDHVHPNQSQPPPDPNEKDARLQHFTWTAEEDQQLKALHSQFPTNWSLISDVFNSSRVTIPTDVRSAWDCYQRLSSISKLDVKDEHPVGRLGTPSELGKSSTVPKEGWSSKASVKKPPPAQSKAVGKRATRHALLHDAIRKTIKKREFKPAGKSRSNQTLHDTHQVVSQQKHHTPAELSRIKYERDQQHAQQQMLLERRRLQESARQVPRSGQTLSVPNIAQQPRMGVTPISAAQPVPRAPGMTQGQQQNALLQTQRNVQQPQHPGPQPQHANAPMQTALAQGVLGPPGTSSSPVPGHSSPHPASSVVNTRPSSAVSMNGSPQSSSQLSPAQAQTAAISYANRGPASNNIDQFRGLQSIPQNAAQMHQMIWSQQRMSQQQQSQASRNPSVAPPGPSSTPQPPAGAAPQT
ncbi:hypothetical protein BS47DRAFT_1487193 [Hydnum rufescens UP504]|uniref:Vacuolar import and degradation protein 21 n=1 Tax=Hydnum rufescens UP504 TaxID=1448309 RepID=A0A9P6AS47_9AGAM|nr:hypothetical protein BS47DRAFT_1487193 [Hydnum rufescens UP504]